MVEGWQGNTLLLSRTVVAFPGIGLGIGGSSLIEGTLRRASLFTGAPHACKARCYSQLQVTAVECRV